MSLLGLAEWLAATRGSTALHESQYVYPLVESTHVLTLTLFAGTVALLDLRLLGLALRRVPVSQVVARVWLRMEAARASVSKRRRRLASPTRAGEITFRATSRPSRGSRPR